jgi:hypothetical protein
MVVDMRFHAFLRGIEEGGASRLNPCAKAAVTRQCARPYVDPEDAAAAGT